MKSQAQRIQEVGLEAWLDEEMDLDEFYGPSKAPSGELIPYPHEKLLLGVKNIFNRYLSRKKDD